MPQVAILHYSSYPIIGGVENTIYYHSRGLTRADIGVQLIAGRGSQFNESIPYFEIPELDSKNQEVLSVTTDLATGNVTEGFDRLKDSIYHQLRSALQGIEILIVHNAITLHKNLPLTAALHIISQDKRLKLIGWCHDFAWQDALYIPQLHPDYPWNLLRTAWPGVQYIAVSEHRREMLANLLGLPPEKVLAIPPGVTVEELFHLDPITEGLLQRLKLLEADPLVLLPARITRRKNIQFAIHVINALKQNRPGLKLIISGPPGPHNPSNLAYLRQLEDLTKSLEVEEIVHFLYKYGEDGDRLHVSNEMMGSLYQISDLLIFPSLREGFGIPALEAGLFRLPIFASDIPSVRESTQGLANYFDPSGNPEIVAELIDEFLTTDQAYQMRRRVLSHYTWEAIIRAQIIPLLDRVQESS